MKKATLSVFVSLLLLQACEIARDGFGKFKLASNPLLHFEVRYYDSWSDTVFVWDTLELTPSPGLEWNGNTYTAFYDGQDSMEYVFNPIRYSDGYYYELRDGDVELVFLKDKMQAGDTWVNTFEEFELYMEVIAIHEEFAIDGKTYGQVYEIKEDYQNRANPNVNKATSYHFYSKKLGILRRDIPPGLNRTFVELSYVRVFL